MINAKSLDLRLLKNFLLVTIGTVGAQVVTMMLSPFITRIYGPELFGIFGGFNALVAILTPIAALSYPMSIVLPDDDKDSFYLIVLSFALSIIICCFSALLFYIFNQGMMSFLNLDKKEYVFILLPVIIFFTVNIEVLNYKLIKLGRYRFSAKTVFFQSVIINLLKLGFGYYSPTINSLILTTILGMLLSIVFLFIGVKDFLMIYKIKQISYNQMITLALKYIDYPKYRMPQNVIANINQSIPVIMLTTLFGAVSAGYYVLCRTVLMFPVALISKSINDVMYPELNRAANSNQSLSARIKWLVTLLVFIGLIPLSIIFFFGRDLFGFVFGSQWSVAGEYSKWLSIWLYFTLINRPCVAVIPVLKLERFLLKNSILNFTLSVAGLFFGKVIFNNDIAAIAGYSILGVIPQVLIMVFVFLELNKHDSNIMKSV